MSFGNEKRKAEEGIMAAGAQAYERSKMTPEEQAQYSGSFKSGDLLNQAYLYRAGLGPKPSGYTEPTEAELFGEGPLASTLYQSALAGAKDPYAAYISSLTPQLQLAEDYINRSAQGRGLLQSGIPIEQMGRAGVDLAIKDAQARMAARSEELARAAGVYDVINQNEQTRFDQPQRMYEFQQSKGGQDMNRQAQAAWQNAQYQAYPGQAALGSAYGKEAALWALPGQALGAIGAGIGYGMGGQIGRSAVSGLGNAFGNVGQAAQTASAGIPQNAYDYQAQLGNQSREFGRSAIKNWWE